MSQTAGGGGGGPAIPVTVENAAEWEEIATVIEKETTQPPPANLESLTAFVAECVQMLIDADTAHNADLLRGNFADAVITQLIHFSGALAGCTAKGVDMTLIGPRPGPNPVVRSRVVLTVSEPSHEVSRREQFWDVDLGTATAVTGSKTCPNCGAPLGPGQLVCPYCHSDTAVVERSPLQVVKLERIQ